MGKCNPRTCGYQWGDDHHDSTCPAFPGPKVYVGVDPVLSPTGRSAPFTPPPYIHADGRYLCIYPDAAHPTPYPCGGLHAST